MLVLLDERAGNVICRYDARVGSDGYGLGRGNNPEWKTVALSSTGELVRAQRLSVVVFAGVKRGKWNLEPGGGGRRN